EEDIKRLPPGTAMLVSNEIEHPVTVKVRPRKSRHGGVSTPIVGGEKAKAPTRSGGEKGTKPASTQAKGTETKPDAGPKYEKKDAGGGFLRKILGK
ncbi:MAG: ATPase, partial [Candidatus Altiarchaeota archaeon]|nr:ATPase [Candidatus Altiarchaeota archaeon]